MCRLKAVVTNGGGYCYNENEYYMKKQKVKYETSSSNLKTRENQRRKELF